MSIVKFDTPEFNLSNSTLFVTYTVGDFEKLVGKKDES
jgi:hypothetical protein